MGEFEIKEIDDLESRNPESENSCSNEIIQAEQNYSADIDSILQQNITHKEESLEGVLLNQDEIALLFSNSENQSDKTNLSDNDFNDDSAGQIKPEYSVDIESILNEQCCRNCDLNDGFRPVTDEELERLFSSEMPTASTEQVPVLENPTKEENSVSKEESPKTETAGQKTTEEKPKKKRSYKRRKTSKKDAEKKEDKKILSEEPSVESTEISATESEIAETVK